METKLKGKTVFVTDALRNFGTPVALAFAREGANLFLATLSDQAQLDLSHTIVTADQPGHVVQLSAAVGEYAQPGTNLTMFVPDSTTCGRDRE